jgi:hypothetical protein
MSRSFKSGYDKEWNPTKHRNEFYGVIDYDNARKFVYQKIPSVNEVLRQRAQEEEKAANYPDNVEDYTRVRELIKSNIEREFNLANKLSLSYELEKIKNDTKERSAIKAYRDANRALKEILESANARETELNNYYIKNKGYLQIAINNKLVDEIMEEIYQEYLSKGYIGGVKRPTKPVAKRPVAKRPVAKRPVAKRPVAKRPVAKRPVAKRPVAKRPVAKRPVAKRA